VAKILLVEDDFSLRDIYSARFQAEGYNVVTASDGEEALAIAVREHPDLMVLDVMMPKISGFDVLDILRSTPETKNTKVIMMTALSQDTDRQRGEALGVNKYLVKSQVTLEDVIVAAKQVLGEAVAPAGAPPAPASPKPPTAQPAASAEPATPPPTNPTPPAAPPSGA
jgi:two-component system, OmpR family, response regulator RpaB